MNDSISDARFLELRILARLEKGSFSTENLFQPTAERDLIAFLLVEAFVNDVGNLPWSYRSDYDGLTAHGEMFQRVQRELGENLNRLLGGQPVRLSISHRGRVRLAELRQALLAGKSREPFGIL